MIATLPDLDITQGRRISPYACRRCGGKSTYPQLSTAFIAGGFQIRQVRLYHIRPSAMFIFNLNHLPKGIEICQCLPKTYIGARPTGRIKNYNQLHDGSPGILACKHRFHTVLTELLSPDAGAQVADDWRNRIDKFIATSRFYSREDLTDGLCWDRAPPSIPDPEHNPSIKYIASLDNLDFSAQHQFVLKGKLERVNYVLTHILWPSVNFSDGNLKRVDNLFDRLKYVESEVDQSNDGGLSSMDDLFPQ